MKEAKTLGAIVDIVPHLNFPNIICREVKSRQIKCRNLWMRMLAAKLKKFSLTLQLEKKGQLKVLIMSSFDRC